MNLTPEIIESRLSSRQQNPDLHPQEVLPSFSDSALQPAAVIMPVYRQAASWHLLFIKRSDQDQDRHRGQIAFPGGRREEQDSSLLDTALREAEEEITLLPRDVRVLGALDGISTVTDYQVTPFVGLIPWPYPLEPDQREVERVLSIPLAWLANPDNRERKLWPPSEINGEQVPVYFFDPYQGDVLWGASAQLVVNFLNAVLPGHQEPLS